MTGSCTGQFCAIYIVLHLGIKYQMPGIHRRKKIFYRPGMISLLIREKADEHRLHTMQVNMPNRQDSSTGFYIGMIPKRKNVVLYLTNYDDEIKVETGRLIARRLKNENDTVTGLKFVFTATCTYGTYVSALSMCSEEYLMYYAQVDDSLLIYMCPNPIDPNAIPLPEMPTL